MRNKYTKAREEKYLKYKNLFIKMCVKAEEVYYNDLLQDTKKSLKKLWDTFGQVINPERAKKNCSIDKLIQGTSVISDSQSISNTFNNYFVEIGKKITDNMPKNNKFLKYLGDKNPSTMFLNPTDKREISKIIGKLNKKKSSGPDLIPVTLIKSCSEHFSNPLSKIINCSFATGIFPQALKLAKVIPVHKKKEKYIVGNYRPISLLSIFSKIIEKAMHTRLYSFLTKFNILYELQFGFRNNHSTTLANIDIVERIRDALDNSDQVLGIYLDLQKAFDTVDHNILGKKLDHYGIRGNTLNWFSSYLSNRSQYVTINNTNSTCKKIEIGVPQGSVLGPILFLLYINDIANFIKDNEIVIMLFADDTNIFIQGKNPIDLIRKAETLMKSLANWLWDNRLSLSIEKTVFSIFHTKKARIPEICNHLTFNDTTIHRVETSKYLGMVLDDTLTWKPHIKYVTDQLVKYTGIFKLISKLIPKACKKQLYYTNVYSRVLYGIEVYGQANSGQIKKIQVMQNRLLKILYQMDWLTPTYTLHKNLFLLTIKDIFKLQVAKFVYKQRSGSLPATFHNYYTTNSKIHRYRTRQSDLLHTNRHISSQGGKTIKYIGIKTYNSLPACITDSPNLKIFKSRVRKHFYCQYS